MFQNLFKIINAILYTIRPSATVGACLLVLAAFDPAKEELMQLAFLMLATFLGSSYCFLVNDIYDREKDLLNNKPRPIATGILPVKVALGMAISCGILFSISTWFLGIVPFALSFVFLLFASIYSLVNLRTGFPANALVAFIVSGTQWGVWLIKPDDYLWSSSLFLFLFTIPREMLLDWLDVSGDKKIGKTSLPIQLTHKQVKWLIVLFLFLATGSLMHSILKMNSSYFMTACNVLTVLSGWVAFLPFLLRADHKTALLSVRASHFTFAFLILALLSR